MDTCCWRSNKIGPQAPDAEYCGHLESYLSDLYDDEIKLSTDEKELRFIQTGVETLVNKLTETLIQDDRIQTSLEALKSERHFETLRLCMDDRVLPVGSFYEGTKNRYPDEFDFIVQICETDAEEFTSGPEIGDRLTDYETNFQVLYPIFRECYAIINNFVLNPANTKEFLIEDVSGYKLSLQNVVEKRGPSAKLLFHFEKPNQYVTKCKKKIFVDFVTALKVRDRNLSTKVDTWFTCKEFGLHVATTGFYHVVFVDNSDTRVSFVATERDFLKWVLSRKHVKTYKFLKFLINGHDTDKIRNVVVDIDQDHCCMCFSVKRPTFLKCSSYVLKKIIILHHYRCNNSLDNCSLCLVGILESLLDAFSSAVALESVTSDKKKNVKSFAVEFPTLTRKLDKNEPVNEEVYEKCKQSLAKLIHNLKYIDENGCKSCCLQLYSPVYPMNQTQLTYAKKLVCRSRFSKALFIVPIVLLIMFLGALKALD